MKHLFTIFCVLAAVCCGCTTSRLSPEQKAAAMREDSVQHSLGASLIAHRAFMIRTSTLYFQHGKVVQVTPNTNFLSVNDTRAMLQISPRVGGGSNGVGGITLSGNVEAYKAVTKSNGETLVSFTINDRSRMADVSITYDSRRNYASVRAQATYASYSVSFNGAISTYDPSTVVDGSLLP